MKLTITLTDQTAEGLIALAQVEGIAPERVIERLVRYQLATKDIEKTRLVMQAYAQKAGIRTEDDLFDQVS